MIKKFKEKISGIDTKILKVMNLGFKCCLVLGFIACFILLTYHYNIKSPDLYYSGILLVKSSIFFFVDFIVCGFAIDTIRKEIT